MLALFVSVSLRFNSKSDSALLSFYPDPIAGCFAWPKMSTVEVSI